MFTLPLTFTPATHYQVCFTPEQDCTKLITNLIYSAKKSVRLQGYSFTSYKIAHALKYDFVHGIDVKVILDKSNFYPGQYSQAKYLIKNHVPVWLDSDLRIAHNKVIIVDGTTVETGSFNYTGSAQYHNAENVLIIHSKPLATAYLNNWTHRMHLSEHLSKMMQIAKPLNGY